jgi:hypothetical protein
VDWNGDVVVVKANVPVAMRGYFFTMAESESLVFGIVPRF